MTAKAAGAVDLNDVQVAYKRIQSHIRNTLLDPSPYYSQLTHTRVYFKCENLQQTGSFKARGALNKILSLPQEEREKGLVTASTGNHGAAVSFAAQIVGCRALVFVPETAAQTKVDNIERWGAEIRHFGTDGLETELEARRYAENNGLTYVPPYNDPQVIAGQGTTGLELLAQLPDVDAVFVAVGGGGLIGGIATYLKAAKPDVQIIGCSPQNSQVMADSVQAGKLLELPSLPTLSDGTAGGVELDSITFPICRDLVDRYISVTEEEIAESMRTYMNAQHMLIEGAAAVPIAALQKEAKAFRGQTVALVLCGANIDLAKLGKVIAE